MAASLDNLVDDVLVHILQALSVYDVLCLRRTSRRYHRLTKLRCVWYARFRADVLARNLPLPGPPSPISLLSATELERRTLRALHLQRAWPCLSANTLVSKHDRGATDGRVDQVVFIPGGTEVLTVQGDRVVHWLIVSWPGSTHGLKHVGEWTSPDGAPCRVVKDGDVPGVIAVGPRDPSGPHRFAKVLSTSLKAPFAVLRDYDHVSGVVAGVWRHLLMVDTTRGLGRGGLKLLDWRARTNGTALLPCLHDLFGSFLDHVIFAGHLLVVWEHCVSVFSVPHVPANGQVVVEHKRAFMFQEAISRPVGFTTCVARRNHDADLGQDADRDRGARSSPSPALTIAARSGRRGECVSMMVLVPLVDETDAAVFPYRMARPPPHSPPVTARPRNHGGEGGAGCTALCLGSSGRGVFVVGRELRLVSPGLLVWPPCEMEFGPVFETGKAMYLVDRRRRELGRTDENEDEGTDAEEESAGSDRVDFDEGMGRFVVARECGGFEVVQLD